jgi:Gpi18-like mannosyltransferase
MKIKLNKYIVILVLFVLLAILVRLPLLSNSGLAYDMGYWFGWSKGIHDFGLQNVYEQVYTDYVNYPPFMMYLLWFIGNVYTLLGGSWDSPDTIFYVLVKLPGVIFDILTALLIFFIAFKQFKLSYKISISAFVVYAFSPAIIYNSSYWGQVDTINTFFMLLTLFLLYKKKYSLSWAVFGFSLLVKLQVIAILPVLLFVTIYDEKLVKSIKYFIIALFTFLLGSFYFILWGKLFILIEMYINLIKGNVHEFEYGAYNIWWIIRENRLYENRFTPNNVQSLASLLYFGYDFVILLGNFFKTQKERIFLIAALLCFSFFMLPIGVHDRYLYPFLAIFLIYCLKKPKYLIIYLILTITVFANHIQTLKPSIFTDFFNTLFAIPTLGNILSIVHIIIFFYLTYNVLKDLKLPSLKDLFSFWDLGPKNVKQVLRSRD